MEHELKTWPPFFQAVVDGTKTFEIRKNDRGFNPGDTLMLREWDNERKDYTGRSIEKTVTYILDGTGDGMGLEKEYVCMGFFYPHSTIADLQRQLAEAQEGFLSISLAMPPDTTDPVEYIQNLQKDLATAQAQLKRLGEVYKEAGKVVNWFERGYLQHSPLCNGSGIESTSMCNCHLIQLRKAYNEYQAALTGKEE